jgi:hypothetical protein
MMPLVGFFSLISRLAGLLLVAVLPLMRLWAVRLRERRGCVDRGGWPVWREAGWAGAVLGLAEGLLAAWSWGKSSWVGDALVPRLPFWLEVVTESDEVAVVVPCGFSILAGQSQWVKVCHAMCIVKKLRGHGGA